MKPALLPVMRGRTGAAHRAARQEQSKSMHMIEIHDSDDRRTCWRFAVLVVPSWWLDGVPRQALAIMTLKRALAPEELETSS
jgi:hypothetical protein